ncbi:MAG: hypothetical protein AAFZ74_02555 [Pseudomonadota bacterium]
MADREAYNYSASDIVSSGDREAERVQDFADALRYAIHANTSKAEGLNDGVLIELEEALCALDALIANGRTGNDVVELFSKPQNNTSGETSEAPEATSVGTKPE